MRFEMWRRGDDAEITCWLHKPIDLSSGLLLTLQSWEQGQVSIAIAKGCRDGRLPGAHCLTSRTELMKVQRQILSHRCGRERSRKTFKLSSGIHMCMHTGACITVWTCTETISTHVYPSAKFKRKLQVKILLDNLEYRYKYYWSNF